MAEVVRTGRDSAACDYCGHGKLNHDDNTGECWVRKCDCLAWGNEMDEALLGFDRW